MSTPRILGFVLLGVGFFGSAFFAVRRADSADLEWATVEWPAYGVTFVIGVLGVVLLRTTARAAGTHSDKLDANLKTLHESLARINERLASIQSNRDAMGVYAIHEAIDEQLVVSMGEFADARETLIHVYSLHDYAAVMDRFARGERMINRAWSASADGYINEVWSSLDNAQAHLQAAEETLTALRDRT